MGKANADVKAFEGTLKVHQVIFDSGPSKLSFRSLSCFSCKNKCGHFHMGEGFARNKENPALKGNPEKAYSGKLISSTLKGKTSTMKTQDL